MANSVYIKDSEHRFIFFGRYGWEGQEIAQLRATFEAADSALGRAKAPASLELIEAFLKRVDAWAQLNDFTFRAMWPSAYNHPDARWLLLPARSDTVSEECHKITGDAQKAFSCIQEAQWAASARTEVNKALRSLRSKGCLSEQLALVGQLTSNPFASVLARVKKMPISSHSITAANRLGQDEAYACFFPDENGYFAVAGTYYSCKNPLARAQTFESAKAAQTAMSRRGFSAKSYVIARIECRASAVINPEGAPLGDLAEAMSQAEAQALNNALESAQIERLRERLKELEAARPPEAPAPKRARLGL